MMDQAHDRLDLARIAIDSSHLEGAVSVAYYAMRYAARAALSEDDEYARTHRGTWYRFRERYVITDVFDQHLYELANSAQSTREKGDYEAVTPSREEAERIVNGAGDFVAAVEHMLDV